MCWGIYCAAAIEAGEHRPWRVAHSKRQAQAVKAEADRTCQSGARHFIKRIPAESAPKRARKGDA